MGAEHVTALRQRSRGNLAERVNALSPAALSRFERLPRRTRAKQSPNAIPLRHDRNIAPLSFAQERLWFLDRLAPGNSTYNLAMLASLEDASVPVLKRCLYELTRRRESLRTTITLHQGAPIQRIHDPFLPHLTERDLRGLRGDKLNTAWRELSAQEASRPFDLTRGSLFRTCLYRLTETNFMPQRLMPHSISDGW